MDTNDFKLIKHLMAHARATWAELGGLLGLSAPAAAERVRKLEETGVIQGYAALIDPEAVGCTLSAYISVTLDRQERRPQFLELVGGLAEIVECHHVAGAEDYILKIFCSSPRHLEQLINEMKAAAGAQTRTTIVLSTVKATPILPVGLERG